MSYQLEQLKSPQTNKNILNVVILYNALSFINQLSSNNRNKISDELIDYLSDVLVEKRVEYIQLLEQCSECFVYEGIKIETTIDSELKKRYILENINEVIDSETIAFLSYLSKRPDINPKILLVIAQNINSDNLVNNLKASSGILKSSFEEWKRDYLNNPLGYLTIFNTEFQAQIENYLKFGSDQEKKDVASLLDYLNFVLNFIFNTNDKNIEDLLNSEDEESDVFGTHNELDILTNAETMIKRIRSILKKLLNLHSGSEPIQISEFEQNVNDPGRYTGFLDSISDIDNEKLITLLKDTDYNLKIKFRIGSVIILNNIKYTVKGLRVAKDIVFKITRHSAINYIIAIDTIDENNTPFTFKVEIQNQTHEALEAKKIEDKIYEQRKNVRNSLVSLAYFNKFEGVIKSQNEEFKSDFMARIGLLPSLILSKLSFEDYINSSDYRNLFLDCLIINFPTLVDFIYSKFSKNNEHIGVFRFFQDLVPISFQMRRFVAEGRILFKDKGVFKSTDDAWETYNALIESRIDNVSPDITDIDLESRVSLINETLYFGSYKIGHVSMWSKILRCSYGNVRDRIQLLMSPTWHKKDSGSYEKIPEINTRFIVVDRKTKKIALIINMEFLEVELPGTDTLNITNDQEKIDFNKISKVIYKELGKNVENLEYVDESIKGGLIMLKKKMKNVSFRKMYLDRNQNQPDKKTIYWIDPIEIIIWKYWLNKPSKIRPEKYILPLAPYATFTDEILTQLYYDNDTPFNTEIISKINKIVADSMGSITTEEIREKINL